MSVAISRVPAATTLQDMRSRGPPEDRGEGAWVTGEGEAMRITAQHICSQENKASEHLDGAPNSLVCT